MRKAVATCGDTPAKRRVAIYTRKSTEEGLEQAFNSLDAQREACAAYIASQRHEGWSPVPDIYDDGGFSGGTMERPALKALLAEVAANRVHVIVVYKVDRLTRSLADFAKIVDVLDAAGASFVSVTQSFNTTTSMGRLTLNMLLSFAQFEREVTAERIRDKIAASKARGMYMGGSVPLGYDRADKKLVVNEAEAETVRFLYRRYLELGSGHRLLAELDRLGIRSKARVGRDGRNYGNQPITRGALYALLQNRIYVGEVAHKGSVYPGEHAAILDRALFDAVQVKLGEQRVEHRHRTRAEQPSLLTGVLYDQHGRRMTPSHACKGARRYRYYISQVNPAANAPRPVCRVSASDLEAAVLAELGRAARETSATLIRSGQLTSDEIVAVQRRADSIASALSSGRAMLALTELLTRVDLLDDALRLQLDLRTLHPSLAEAVEVTRPMTLATTGRGKRIILDGPAASRPADPALVKLLAQAHRARAALEQATSSTIDEVAARLQLTPHYLLRLTRLGYLAPDIVGSILDGRQPARLTRLQLVRTTIPLDWTEQRQVLGFS